MCLASFDVVTQRQRHHQLALFVHAFTCLVGVLATTEGTRTRWSAYVGPFRLTWAREPVETPDTLR